MRIPNEKTHQKHKHTYFINPCERKMSGKTEKKIKTTENLF